MVKGLDYKAFNEAVDTIKECNGVVMISDLGITINGTQIDTLIANEAYEGGGDRIQFFAGNPTNENDDYWEELFLSVDEMNSVLNDFNDLF